MLKASRMATRTASIHDESEVIEQPSAEQPSGVSAAERAVEAAQRIAVERLELMRLEFMDGISGLLKRTGLILAAGLVTILGWCGLATALVIVLAERMPLAAAVAAVAGTHVVAGIVLGVTATSIAGRKAT